MDLVEEVGESSSPPRSYGSFGGGGGNDVIRNDLYNRLIDNGNEEAINNPDFRELLEAHFNRLPQSYTLDINMDRVEDVLLHRKLLARAKDPESRPVFHIRFIENQNVSTKSDCGEQVSSTPKEKTLKGTLANGHSVKVRKKNPQGNFETCSKLEVLNLEVQKNGGDLNGKAYAEDLFHRVSIKMYVAGRKQCLHQFMKLYFQLWTGLNFLVSFLLRSPILDLIFVKLMCFLQQMVTLLMYLLLTDGILRILKVCMMQ